MPPFYACLLSALFTLAFSPSEAAINASTFSQDVSNPDEAAARSAARLARKYATKVSGLERRTNTHSVVSAAAPAETHSAGIDQDGVDFSYFIQVGVGSNQKPLLMLLDTGGGITWLMGSTCQSTACTTHDTFGPSDSKTLTTNTNTFSVNYGTGSVSGSLVKDSMSTAGLDVDMTFGLANVTSDDFNNFPFDGILGLSMNNGTTDNFLQILTQTKSLPANIFSVALSRNSDGPNTGEVTFGATDSSKFTGNIGYTPIAKGSAGTSWAVLVDDFGFNGKKAGVTKRPSYIDTGTSWVLGPAADVAALHKLIPGATSSDGVNWQVPCDTTTPVEVIISGVSYAISPRDWIVSGTGNCSSNIHGHEVVEGSFLLGDVFLKNVYAVFDFDQSRVGFAARPASTAPTSTSASPVVSTQAATTMTSNGVVTTRPAATVTLASSGSTDLPGPGLSGHETAATVATALPQSSSVGASPTSQSPADQLETNKYASIVCVVVAVIAMVA